VSNVSRAVTRTRRAGHARREPASLAPMLQTLALARQHARQHPPFTVTRRAPKSRAPRGHGMGSIERAARYEVRDDGNIAAILTGAQIRRVWKKAHRNRDEEALHEYLLLGGAPPRTPVSKPGQKGDASGKGQGKGGRTDPGGPVSPPPPKGKP